MSKKFFDQAGREWNVTIDCGTVARVYDVLGIDLGDPGAENDKGIPVATQLLGGVAYFLKVLAVVCLPEIQMREMDQNSFISILPVDKLGDIKKAFMEEWANFFRSSNPKACQMMEAMTRYEELRRTQPTNSPQLKQLEDLMATAFQPASQPATP